MSSRGKRTTAALDKMGGAKGRLGESKDKFTKHRNSEIAGPDFNYTTTVTQHLNHAPSRRKKD
jgi:hypothetical protein